MAISLTLRYACCTWVKGLKRARNNAASFIPARCFEKGPLTIHANSQTQTHSHRVVRECIKQYSYARTTSWVWHVQGKENLQGIRKDACAQTYTNHTEPTHTWTQTVRVLVWELSQIWKGTAVTGCINYKKIMNQSKGKSACMQVRVCISVLPTCLLYNKCADERACAQALCVVYACVRMCLWMQVPSICTMRHWAAIKKQEMRQEYNQGDRHSFIKPIRWPDGIWLCH